MPLKELNVGGGRQQIPKFRRFLRHSTVAWLRELKGLEVILPHNTFNPLSPAKVEQIEGHEGNQGIEGNCPRLTFNSAIPPALILLKDLQH